MDIIVDANILIAALLKDSTIREIIINTDNQLLVPEIHFEEIEEHKKELLEKSTLSEVDFYILISKLSKYFKIVKNEEILPFIKEADNIMGKIDKDDVPIIATSLAYGTCPIWSDDYHFKQQKKIKIFTTKEIISKEILHRS
jgi:predicted nucleic acid-binding protein